MFYTLPSITTQYHPLSPNANFVSKISLLSPSKTALNFRGGGGAITDIVLKDFSQSAAGYFSNIRLPASVFVGSSLGAIFTLSGLLKKKDSLCKIEKRALVLYHYLTVLSFILSMTVVVISTACNTAILHGRFNPMAETAYLLLKREFEYEFVTVRFSYLMSMLSFLSAITLRILIEFELLKPGNNTNRMAAGLSFVAVVTHLFSYVNDTLFCFPNLFRMAVHAVELNFQRFWNMKNPLEIISTLSALVAFVLYLKQFFPNGKENEQ